MSAIENLGVTLEGPAFANVILFERLRTENLRRCVAALQLANPDGADELLAEVLVQLQVMLIASNGMLSAHLHHARGQGLEFEIVPTSGDMH